MFMRTMLKCLLVSTLAFGQKCPPGTQFYTRHEESVKVEFCGKISSICPSGEQTESLGVTQNGKPACALAEGEARYLSRDGSRVVMNYKAGVLNGKVISFAKNGKKMLEEAYVLGLKEGKRTEFYDLSGKPKSEDTFKRGQREGGSQGWYANGKLHFKTTYKNGRKHGKYEEWYDNGKLKAEIAFTSGSWWGKYRENYSSGTPFSEGEYRNNNREGIFRNWHRNGKLASQRSYAQGLLHGLATEWDSNGVKTGERRFQQGRLDATLFAGNSLGRGLASLAHCGELASPAIAFTTNEGKCLRLDANGDGHTDVAITDPKNPKQTLLMLLQSGGVVKEIIVPEPTVELYPVRSSEGQFGEPATPREGLVVWGRGQNTRVYLYDYDAEKLSKTEHASDMY